MDNTREAPDYNMLSVSDVNEDASHIRRTRTDITALKNTISDVGLLQPIIVRRSADGYVIIDGQRRLQALKELDVRELIIGREVIIDIDETVADAKFKQVIANIQRKDINAIELGHAFLMLKVQYGYQFNEIAEIIGKTPHYVTAKVGLSRRMTPEVQNMVIKDWESATVNPDMASDEDTSGTYQMNITVIEDIARLPAELQKNAYETIKAEEMDWKEALAYLRSVKNNPETIKTPENPVPAGSGLKRDLIVDCDGGEPAREVLTIRFKKIDRDIEQLAVSIKTSMCTDREKLMPALESLIEKMHALYDELKSQGQSA